MEDNSKDTDKDLIDKLEESKKWAVKNIDVCPELLAKAMKTIKHIM